MKTTLSNMTVYSDCSGANALVSVDGMLFACHWTSALRVYPVGGTERVKRGILRAAIASAEVAFAHALMNRTTPEWRASCAAMYAGDL